MRRKSLRTAVLGIMAAITLAAAPAAATVSENGHAAAEVHLQRALDLVDRGRIDEAINEIEKLVARYPNFRLAYLVQGDLLLARTRPIRDFGSAAPVSDRLTGLRAELAARVRDSRDRPPANYVPRYLMRLEPTQKHAIVVDTSRARVYVFRNVDGTPRLVRDYYSTIGKHGISKEREGDKKTPIGAYYVTSYIPGKKLPDLYGWGAFPISYPNEWDRRRGRTGYGIWIHGVPSDNYARAPLASDGCLALANPEIGELAERVQPGSTPVVISERVEWLAPQAWRAEADAFGRQLEAWRRDWESRDSERYLAHYARAFSSDGMDLAAWSAHKRRVNAAKKWIKVQLEAVSVLRSPGREPLIVVTFEQDYRSSSLSQRTRKRQYWALEDGRWKIAYEAPVQRAAPALPESYPKSRTLAWPVAQARASHSRAAAEAPQRAESRYR